MSFKDWTTREIVVASVLAVAVGVVFWAWGLLWSSAFQAIPFPFSYALVGVWMVGGLLVSQVLTLFTTPAIYLAFDALARRLGGRSAAAPATEAAVP